MHIQLKVHFEFYWFLFEQVHFRKKGLSILQDYKDKEHNMQKERQKEEPEENENKDDKEEK